MTTDTMFLQDMKTMMKEYTDGTRCGGKTDSGNSILMGRKCHAYASQVPYLAGIDTIFAKAMLPVLLFLGGENLLGALGSVQGKIGRDV